MRSKLIQIKTLEVLITISVIVASLAIAYYFGIFRPKFDKQTNQMKIQKEEQIRQNLTNCLENVKSYGLSRISFGIADTNEFNIDIKARENDCYKRHKLN